MRPFRFVVFLIFFFFTASPVLADVFTVDLYSGDTHPEAFFLQQYLNTHGYEIAKTGPGSPGQEIPRLGPATLIQLKKLQIDKGIPPTGIVGERTRAILNGISTGYVPVSSLQTSLYDVFTVDLYSGDTHPEAFFLQQYLNTHGYEIAKTGPGSPGQEIPRLGPATLIQLKKFQASNGLPATGIVGERTRAILNGTPAVPPPVFTPSIVSTISWPMIPPTLTITASPRTVKYKKTTIITWSAPQATSCKTPWNSKAPPRGTHTTKALATTTVYSIICSGPRGTVTSSIRVIVLKQTSHGGGSSSGGVEIIPTPTTLTITKTVIGGTATTGSFTYRIDGSSVPLGSNLVTPGTHTVTETDGPTDYIATFGDSCTASGTILVVSNTNVTCSITNTFAPPPSVEGLIASYNMDEGGGAVLNDRSGNGRSGTLVSTPTWAPGKNGDGLTFDGTDNVDLVSQVPLQGIPQFTISAWVKRAAPGSAVLIGKQNGDNTTSIQLWTDGIVYFAVSAGAGAYGTLSLNDADWHYVSMVFDGNQTGNTNRLKAYVDGVLQTLAFTGVIPALTTSTTDSFGLGSLNGVYSNGQIDDVRIYNRSLTASEIALDMGTPVVDTVTPAPIPFSTLEERMQLFRDGALHGFALSSLPEDEVEPYSESDYQDLADTGANVVRVPIILRKALSGDSYDIPEADIAYAENILTLGSQYGFRVFVTLVALPWGDAPSDYWGNASLMTDLASKWALIAGRLKGYSALQAYDMINEPVITGVERVSGLTQWHDLAVSLGQAVQSVDSNTPIMFEPHPWGLPGSFWQAAPLGLSGVVYSFHMYEPATFTSQGINGYPEPVVYPSIGLSSTTLYDYMLEARTIATRDNIPMFVGEFSCLRWGPGCTQYLTDLISMFADENWGWTYHTWRAYQGWDAEIPSTITQVQAYPSGVQYRTATSTSFMLLKDAMSGNQTF